MKVSGHSSNMELDEEHLIDAVERRTALYDKTDPKYSNRDYNRKMWEEVAAEIDADVELAKRRWGHLRDYFMKLFRADQLAKAGKVPAKKRKWPFFDSMLFLVPHIQQKDAYGNVGRSSPDDDVYQEEEPGNSESDYWSSESVTQDMTVSFKRPSPASYRFQSAKRQRLSAGPSELDLEQEEEDENALFFKSLLPMVRTLSPIDAMDFRHEVHGLLIRYVKQKVAASVSAASALATSASDSDNMANSEDVVDDEEEEAIKTQPSLDQE